MYLILDFETTGFVPGRHRPVSVSAMLLDQHFTAQGEFSSHIHPEGAEISSGAMAVHGLSLSYLATQPKPRDVYRDLLPWLVHTVLVGHNSPFDIGFLQAELQREGLPAWDGDFIDTLSLSRLLYPKLASHRLGAMCEYFGIPVKEAHSAGGDARMTRDLFKLLLPAALEARYDPLNLLTPWQKHPVRTEGLPRYHMVTPD